MCKQLDLICALYESKPGRSGKDPRGQERNDEGLAQYHPQRAEDRCKSQY